MRKFTEEEIREENERYYESLKRKYRVEIMALETIVNALEEMKEVVKQFDGKVYTKRFVNAMHEKFPIDHDKKIPQASFEISKYAYNELEIEIGIRLYNCRIMFEGNSVNPRSYNYEKFYNFMLDNEKRISAEKWIENIENIIESRNETIEKLKSHANNEYFISIQKEREEVENAIRQYQEKLDIVTGETFKIRTYLTR